MAPMWHLIRVKSLCWMLHALVVMTTPQEIHTAYVTTGTEAPRSSCIDIHGQAFGDETLKPGVCYLLSGEKGVFLDARTFCQGLNDSLGWDVADIEDAVEQQLIHDAITVLKTAGLLIADSFWIGQNDMKTEGVWRYLNDSSSKCNQAVYLNWETNQPDGGRRKNCVIYHQTHDGMKCKGCDDSYSYLCKVKLTSDTVPSCPNFTEDTSTDTPDECATILPNAFGNPSVPGMCYASDSDQTRTFEDALSFCRSLPGGNWSVIDIEDHDENLFLETWNRDNCPENDGYWIGQNDREQEGNFQYTSSGRCPVYLNWQMTQPDGLREENCLVMIKRPSGFFHDKDCNVTERYYTLCELKTDSNPTGGSLTSCSWNILSAEVAACSSLRTDAFGRVDKQGVCYFTERTRHTWQSAVDFCKNEGWSLIDIEGATENEMLVDRLRRFGPGGYYYWVGQNDREIEGTWKYLSNDTPSDAGVFLNNQVNGDESKDCIGMTLNGGWFGISCSSKYYVICKKRIDIPSAQPCSKSSSVARPRRFVFLSSDATCNPRDALAPSYHAKSRIQCARDCLSRDDCQGFGFVAAGKEDDCVLCSRVLDVQDLQFKAGSLYYNEAL